MILNASLTRRACLAVGAACLALSLGGCFDSGGSGGSDSADSTGSAGGLDDAPAEVPIVTAPSTPVAEPGDACACAAPDTQRSCAP
ncbi:hypothetical protein [Achromobacter aloeverae]